MYRPVLMAADLAPGRAREVMVAGRPIALFNVEGTFYALDDRCPHADGPLSEGELDGHVVQCPWHLARFDIRDGKNVAPPACADVDSFAVRVLDGVVEIDL